MIVREKRDTLRSLHKVDDPSVSERAALEFAVFLEPKAVAVSWYAQKVAFRYVRLFGFEAALSRMGYK